MDDNSPDGTGMILDELSRKHENLKVLHRSGKLGIGSAHRDGLLWAYNNGFKACITMDCDFTHPPEYIPELIKLSDTYDMVITSRYLKKGSLSDWNLFRKTLTNLGHFLTYNLLKMKYDATGAFRLYRLDRIPKHFLDLINSNSYSFFFESLFILNFNKFRIKEIPIILPARTYGHSKMRVRDAFGSLKFLLIIFLNTLFNREKFEIGAPLFTEVKEKRNDEWESYWQGQKSGGGLLYELIAVFYRKFIIKPALNHFIRKYFRKGSRLLHAGCGGGQVDIDICTQYEITGLDISVNSLNMHNKVTKGKVKLLHGSILNIPGLDGIYDGIYNLGVMEHFSVNEIRLIMDEFKRVLRPDGKIVLFWPPEYGISVIFFKLLKVILSPFYGSKIKFHPTEITRIKSKKELISILGVGFQIEEYYFGYRSLATYTVCVLSLNPQ
jgi:dolichol-phosphate mannosyltransferase